MVNLKKIKTLLDIDCAVSCFSAACCNCSSCFFLLAFRVDCILISSSLSGLGMKPTSHPSLTRRPIHQSLLNF